MTVDYPGAVGSQLVRCMLGAGFRQLDRGKDGARRAGGWRCNWGAWQISASYLPPTTLQLLWHERYESIQRYLARPRAGYRAAPLGPFLRLARTARLGGGSSN